MSTSFSIFQKLCPSCASSVSVAAAQCGCGHIFEAADGAVPSSDEASLRDEELYENYLAARATQAQEAARAAQDALADDPKNSEKKATAELATEVAASLDADLNEQRAKIAALRRAVSAARPRPVAPAPAVAATKPPTANAPKAAVKSAPVAMPVATQSCAAPAVPPSELSPVTTAATKAAGALAAIKSAKAREVAVRTQQAMQAAAAARTEALPATAVSSAPPAAFRAEQAAKAEKAVGAPKSADLKECPNCTASVPTATTRCRCGFTFAQGGNDLPTLTLCTGDFTALRNSLNLNTRGRN